jgi:hypothetical protein
MVREEQLGRPNSVPLGVQNTCARQIEINRSLSHFLCHLSPALGLRGHSKSTFAPPSPYIFS